MASSKGNQTPPEFSVALAAVTYKRPELLAVLLESITQMTWMPRNVIIVDNNSKDGTAEVVENFRQVLGKNDAGEDRLIYAPQEENTGGAGGFSIGTGLAYDTGAEWIWLMDDDVAVEPNALELLYPWSKQFQVIQGRRHNYDGKPFYWQYHVDEKLGIPSPIAKEDFDTRGYLPMNTMCFEGAFFNRNIARQIGLPDPRFFIYWDDSTYGYLASRVTPCVAVGDFVLRRTRPLKFLDLKLRRLNSTSDMVRYYIMRNRAYVAKYMALHGDLNRMAFGFGTFLTFIKETIRITTVDRSFRGGFSALIRGVRDGRKIHRDRAWKPMPPLD